MIRFKFSICYRECYPEKEIKEGVYIRLDSSNTYHTEKKRKVCQPKGINPDFTLTLKRFLNQYAKSIITDKRKGKNEGKYK